MPSRQRPTSSYPRPTFAPWIPRYRQSLDARTCRSKSGQSKSLPIWLQIDLPDPPRLTENLTWKATCRTVMRPWSMALAPSLVSSYWVVHGPCWPGSRLMRLMRPRMSWCSVMGNSSEPWHGSSSTAPLLVLQTVCVSSGSQMCVSHWGIAAAISWCLAGACGRSSDSLIHLARWRSSMAFAPGSRLFRWAMQNNASSA